LFVFANLERRTGHPVDLIQRENDMETVLLALILISLVSFFALFYTRAEQFYDFSRNLRDSNPTLFMIIGRNEKYLNDKAKWIRYHRLYILLMAMLFTSILIPFFFI
jgi:hypothetical protein